MMITKQAISRAELQQQVGREAMTPNLRFLIEIVYILGNYVTLRCYHANLVRLLRGLTLRPASLESHSIQFGLSDVV